MEKSTRSVPQIGCGKMDRRKMETMVCVFNVFFFCTEPLRGEEDQQMLHFYKPGEFVTPGVKHLAKKYNVSRRSEVASNTLCDRAALALV